MKKVLMFAIAAGVGMMALSTTANAAFSTKRCQACHAVDHVKVGPAWKDVAKAYGNEETLAKLFLAGFPVKDRKIASTNAHFHGMASLMTQQYKHLIKGHEKAAAHALFMTVKNNKFGSY